MKSRREMNSAAFSIAVLLCAPFVIRCGSDSGGGSAAGASGELEHGAGSGGVARGGAGSGHAGSGHAGSGESTSGGSDAAGTAGDMSASTAGASASAGTSGASAGTSGASAGTSGASAGTSGASAGTSGASAGTSGASAGTSGASAGTAGSAGIAGAGPGILNVSIQNLYLYGECTVPPQTFTISNTGQSPLTWTAAVGAPLVTLAPSSSTLLPGNEVTVTVSVTTPVQLSSEQSFQITITSDIAAQPPTLVQVTYAVSGTLIGVQPDIDFGEVPLGQTKMVSVPAPPHGTVELALGSSNHVFSVPNLLLHAENHWTLYFTPSVLGPQSSTLQIIVPFGSGGPPCPSPNLFAARGVGIAP